MSSGRMPGYPSRHPPCAWPSSQARRGPFLTGALWGESAPLREEAATPAAAAPSRSTAVTGVEVRLDTERAGHRGELEARRMVQGHPRSRDWQIERRKRQLLACPLGPGRALGRGRRPRRRTEEGRRGALARVRAARATRRCRPALAGRRVRRPTCPERRFLSGSATLSRPRWLLRTAYRARTRVLPSSVGQGPHSALRRRWRPARPAWRTA